MIHEIPALLNTITAENNKLLTEQRNKSIVKIVQNIESVNKSIKLASEIGKLLSENSIETIKVIVNSADLKSVGETVQSVLSQIPDMKSVAEIIAAENDAIKDVVKNNDTLTKSKTIRPADLWTKPYIETKTDAEEFLNKLRNEMENAIDNNERIKIQ
jgi:DNA mismatch repair ATPase MutS